MSTPIVIACNLDALTSAERSRRSSLGSEVCKGSVEIRETERGFRLELKRDWSLYRDVLELIALERRCCPFLELNLTFSPGDGPVYFDIGGNDEVKAFLVSSGVLGCSR